MKALIACLICSLAIGCVWLNASHKEKARKIAELQEQTAKDHNEITTAHDKLAKYQFSVSNRDALVRCMVDAQDHEQELLFHHAVAIRKDGSMIVPVPMIIEARRGKDSEIAKCKFLYGDTH
jgi:hypothetical protein